MSENRLRKYLNRATSPPRGHRKFKPVILSDSKGNHLANHCSNEQELEINWCAKGGRKFEHGHRWLIENLPAKLTRHGKVSLYVWLGTCNLTSVNKDYISLTTDLDETVNKIINTITEIRTLPERHENLKTTILEIPNYSIVKWNTYKGHSDPSSFKDQDDKLQDQIHALNKHIRGVNSKPNRHSPIFSTDLSGNSKYKPGNKNTTKTRHYYNFNLYKDGIHPENTLAKVWLKNITEQIKKVCWEA
ncbi:hypothetical protein KP79_PYT05157 [Mizuhopecten yessoensis]|uniref:Uncharacterized protein n=1 Tax=Mizuhopecten yessoensis TaxID=6573 RepID=A0A210Q0Y8_MIZYE|nr:hypothetical protein KP79_PYT05157 [Mizuhopecten yessoensis]